MKTPTNHRQDKDEAKPRQPLLQRLVRKKPSTERRRSDEMDEIDERELDKISGGRIHRVDL